MLTKMTRIDITDTLEYQTNLPNNILRNQNDPAGQMDKKMQEKQLRQLKHIEETKIKYDRIISELRGE